MAKDDVKYVLTLSSSQAHAVSRAAELLMRLKIRQWDQISYYLLDMGDEDFCDKRDDAAFHLRKAFDIFFDGKPYGKDKDDEWHTLYGIYQVVRHAIWGVENPESRGVDSYEPVNTGWEPLPKIMAAPPDKSTAEELMDRLFANKIDASFVKDLAKFLANRIVEEKTK